MRCAAAALGLPSPPSAPPDGGATTKTSARLHIYARPRRTAPSVTSVVSLHNPSLTDAGSAASTGGRVSPEGRHQGSRGYHRWREQGQTLGRGQRAEPGSEIDKVRTEVSVGSRTRESETAGATRRNEAERIGHTLLNPPPLPHEPASCGGGPTSSWRS